MFACDLGGGIDAVETGHGDIDDGHVRLTALNPIQRCPAVLRLADDGEVGLAFQKKAQAAADHGMIVGDEHAHGVQRGNSAVTMVPRPGSDCTRKRPPI